MILLKTPKFLIGFPGLIHGRECFLLNKDLSRGLVKRIGDGSSTSFCYDTWVDKPLGDCILSFTDYVDANTRVSDFLSISDFLSNGSWNLEILFAQVPLSLYMKIMGYPIVFLRWLILTFLALVLMGSSQLGRHMRFC